MKLFVVAVSLKEAQLVANVIGHPKRADAEKHLREVKAPPTDPFYAQHYKIWEVEGELTFQSARVAAREVER